MAYWIDAMRTIKSADVVLFILDARMPELSRNKDLENKLKNSGKRVLLVFNKSDLVSRKRLEELNRKYRGAFFVSAGKNMNVGKLRTALIILGKQMKVHLEVGVVGYPNVGKSAIINALLRKNKTSVSSKAGTTTGVQWASSEKFKLLDSPGVIPFEDDEVKLGILGAKNAEKLRDLEKVALEIIKIFRENDVEKLEKIFGIKIEKNDEEYDIFVEIGEAKRFLRKGGFVDENRTALTIVRDWQRGKLLL